MHRIGLEQIMLMPMLLNPMVQPLCNVRQRALLVRKHTDCSDLYVMRDEIWLSHVTIPFKTRPVQNVFLSEWSKSIPGHTIPLELFMLLLHADTTASCTSRNSALALEGFDCELPSTLPWLDMHGQETLLDPGTPGSITSYSGKPSATNHSSNSPQNGNTSYE